MPPNIPDSSAHCPEPIGYNAEKERLNIEYSSLGKPVNSEITVMPKVTGVARFLNLKADFVWINVIAITLLHLGSLYTLVTFPYLSHLKLSLWAYIYAIFAGFGVTGGAHRYWTHRTYKANLPLQIILATCYCAAGMNSIFHWVRDHRVHHKYSETDADPHNTNRGFFFSHVGWLYIKKHPEVIRRGNQVDMSDIINDPVVQFVEKHFILLKIIFVVIVPIAIPVFLWNESFYLTFMSQMFLRYPLVLNSTWAVNSFAHFYGGREYDKGIRPAENWGVAVAALGEGWHNYHHAFPWDYKAAELGNRINLTTFLIDNFAKIGWATDLKSASPDLIRKVAENRGDGTHPQYGSTKS